jgi:hypothetical protein
MAERVDLEVDTLTIRIPDPAAASGWPKAAHDAGGAPARKPRRDETLIKAFARAPLTPQDREQPRENRSPISRSRRASRTPTSAGCCHSLAWRPTLWKRSSTGGSQGG